MFGPEKHIEGFIETKALKGLIEGIEEFDFPISSRINLAQIPDIKRLGKRSEFIFEQVINSSPTLDIRFKNVQLIENGRTIGEIDYLIEGNNRLTHLELATKFYLFDEHIGSEIMNQWIGPNRKDFLHLKVSKLKNHQFPIINSSAYKNHQLPLPDNQALLLKAMLFLPDGMDKNEFPNNYKDCISGNWYTIKKFQSIENCLFFVPPKNDWFINPNHNTIWKNKKEVLLEIEDYHSRNFSPMVWVKTNKEVKRTFVVWW